MPTSKEQAHEIIDQKQTAAGWAVQDFKQLNEIYFATNLARSFINRTIKSAAGQNGISGSNLKDIPVAIPPFDVQLRIIAKVEHRLSAADEIEREFEQVLVCAERLRQSILKRAFEGQLVGQNSDDDSAREVF